MIHEDSASSRRARSKACCLPITSATHLECTRHIAILLRLSQVETIAMIFDFVHRLLRSQRQVITAGSTIGAQMRWWLALTQNGVSVEILVALFPHPCLLLKAQPTILYSSSQVV